ncbi:MAG TPA: hypothetical protein VEU96_16500 [Bryobacteraceae bacterium]|nr:hypothetical protein [Bryobacteraceae bacterium]
MHRFAVAASMGTLLISAAIAQEAKNPQIPNLSSSAFGWQTNFEDWQDPPPGYGHGPMKNDPAYPFVNNSVVDNPENAAVRALGDSTYLILNGNQPTVRIANSKDPILKPWAAAAVQATNDEILKGKRQVPFVAQSRCWPGGVPGQLIYPFEPLYFIQTPNEVWMIWQRDHMVRRVFLTDKHSPNLKPSWFGESIGHYEKGNTLVVDTTGLSANKLSYIDNFRTPHTEKEHVVERFTISPDGDTLSAIATVEDPDAYNAPITMMRQWFKVHAVMLETVCAENNGDHFNQNLHPIPEADKPDF